MSERTYGGHTKKSETVTPIYHFAQCRVCSCLIADGKPPSIGVRFETCSYCNQRLKRDIRHVSSRLRKNKEVA